MLNVDIKNLRNLLLSSERKLKIYILMLLDSLLSLLACWISYILRLGETPILGNDFLIFCVISIGTALPVFWKFGFYNEVVRFSDWPVLKLIAKVILIYSIIFGIIVIFIGLNGMPRTLGVIQPILLLSLIFSSRIFLAYFLKKLLFENIIDDNTDNLLIYGAGVAGRSLASALSDKSNFKIKGFLDDNKNLQKRVINGLPILDPYRIDSYITKYQISHVLLAMTKISRKKRHQIIDNITKYKITVQTLPSIKDLANGKISMSDIRTLEIEELLARDQVKPKLDLMKKTIANKTVLVTGAGGSIGGEICKQIIEYGPKKLILIEISEYALYGINSYLENVIIKETKTIKIIPLLGSVTDENFMRRVISKFKPNTIYHAAAYKHVPIVEQNVLEGIKNNVWGTIITSKIALQNGVSNFILISTDKAVRPANIMGATKRLAEMFLQALSSEIDKDSKQRFSMVRFGNVLGSSGSVVPKFNQQIASGGPITLTHLEVTRFFMTIKEAAQLVIQTGAIADGGDVFLLDMGKPIKIVDLAYKMIELSGLTLKNTETPLGDIEVVTTGLRFGEKLYEELLIGNNPQKTIHKKIMRAQESFVPMKKLEKDLKILKKNIESNQIKEVYKIISKLVVGYNENNIIEDLTYDRKKL